jgi:hypothetical protein
VSNEIFDKLKPFGDVLTMAGTGAQHKKTKDFNSEQRKKGKMKQNKMRNLLSHQSLLIKYLKYQVSKHNFTDDVLKIIHFFHVLTLNTSVFVSDKHSWRFTCV